MTYDLRHEPWIPWRRRSGAVEWGPPAMLVSRMADDPVVALATPRPDFDGALQEFLIGLLTVALAPRDELAWRKLWNEPPTEATIQAALAALPPAFDLEGAGSRFLQDLAATEFADAAVLPIAKLLIETPGEQTEKLNKDLFVKRGRSDRLGRPAAAMALLAMQTYAPGGGQGHRTSMRGGGPMTTLVDPRVDTLGASRAHAEPLWHKVWANVELQHELSARAPTGAPMASAAVFPWLAPTRVSTKGKPATTPKDGHPSQAYFGMPRRIRLEFGAAGRCDLTGLDDELTVTGFRMLNYGVEYERWMHPLSPHYRAKPTDAEWLPQHPQPGGLGWRDWISLALGSPAGGMRQPAATVSRFTRRNRGRARLHVFGFDMDNMKARGWLDESFPVFAVSDERHALLLDIGTRLADATGMGAMALLGAVKDALFQSPDEARGEFGAVKQRLWDATAAPFHSLIAALASDDLNDDAAEMLASARRDEFRAILRDECLSVFDQWCPAGGLSPQVMRRRVVARYQLQSTLNGYGKLGAKVFTALGLAPPELMTGKAAKGAKAPVGETRAKPPTKKRSPREGAR